MVCVDAACMYGGYCHATYVYDCSLDMGMSAGMIVGEGGGGGGAGGGGAPLGCILHVVVMM